jgi:hypothetical protein
MIRGIMIGFLLAVVLMIGGFFRFFAKSRYPRRTSTDAEKMH